MIRSPIRYRTRVILGVVGVLVVALAYTWLSYRQHQINPTDQTIPTWQQLAAGVGKVLEVDEFSGDRWLVTDVKATFYRLFVGMASGVFLSVVLGLLMGCYSAMEALFHPTLSFLAKIPPTAMMAVFFVLVGINFEMYVCMIAFGVMPSLAQTVYLSARNDVPDELIHKSYTLGASQAEVIWNVIYKQTLPKVLDAARLQMGPAMVFLIAAEWMVGAEGFGYRIKIQQRLLDMRVVYVYLIVLGGAGFLLDTALIRLRRRLCPWYAE
ncbi:MAG: ABC transporter permease subunit [Planctomycetota bacterium]